VVSDPVSYLSEESFGKIFGFLGELFSEVLQPSRYGPVIGYMALALGITGLLHEFFFGSKVFF
jgi:hypothetical protein